MWEPFGAGPEQAPLESPPMETSSEESGRVGRLFFVNVGLALCRVIDVETERM